MKNALGILLFMFLSRKIHENCNHVKNMTCKYFLQYCALCRLFSPSLFKNLYNLAHEKQEIHDNGTKTNNRRVFI